MLNYQHIKNSTKATFSMVIEMEWELCCFTIYIIYKMIITKGLLNKASFMGREDLNFMMGHATMGTGSMGKNMDMDSIKQMDNIFTMENS